MDLGTGRSCSGRRCTSGRGGSGGNTWGIFASPAVQAPQCGVGIMKSCVVGVHVLSGNVRETRPERQLVGRASWRN